MFKNREEAGWLLAQKLKKDRSILKNAIVIGIPRGGVVVARQIARELRLPLDVIVVKKIGAPFRQELAIGAVGPSNTVFWEEKLIRELGVSKQAIKQLTKEKEEERLKREKEIRRNKKAISVKGKNIIVVDDGVATGATVICSRMALGKFSPEKTILAVPVIAKDQVSLIARYFDQLVILEKEEEFYAVGQFYQEFPQVKDDQVMAILSL